jgi:sialic acid synthase SpsE
MEHTYIIGEIGQNHNGSIEIAKAIIDIASIPVTDELFGQSLPPIDAVKMTKRDLKLEMAGSEMLKPYPGPHSFGQTYGDHRAYLELSDEEHFEVYKHAKEKGLDFVETICAPTCLSLLKNFRPDRLKVASRDLSNLPLLSALSETKIPIILSTGMSGEKELEDALEIITKYHSDITILHCLSQYPAEYKNINLATILYLREKYPGYTIGYSDHSIGISIPVAAVALGARVIEKHITLDRRMKGTDHRGSLGIDGVNRMVRDIRNLELALGKRGIYKSDSVEETRIKLERSIASRRRISKGETIKESDIHLLSPGNGFKAAQSAEVVGKVAKVDIPENEIIYPNMLSNGN